MGKHAFNTVASWLYQARRGKHETRQAEMLSRIATFEGGAELLKRAAALNVPITVVAPKDMGGAQGAFDPENPSIRIANTGNPAGMAMSLWHELRHMLQYAANLPGGPARGGQIRNARTGHFMEMMGEADAFTAETLIALQQKKAGRLEYYDALMKHPGDGPYRAIHTFLQKRPYERFGDDASFSRALFTELMLGGMLSYRAKYLSWMKNKLVAVNSADDFRAKVAEPARDGSAFSPELTAMYGKGYAGVSFRALMNGFSRAQPHDEQMVLLGMETAVRHAPSLTEAEFQAAKRDIVSRVQDVWHKEGESYSGADAARAGDRLRQGAGPETPVPFSQLNPPPAPPPPPVKDYSHMRRPQPPAGDKPQPLPVIWGPRG